VHDHEVRAVSVDQAPQNVSREFVARPVAVASDQDTPVQKIDLKIKLVK
jgi:hypothetical protein